MSWQRAPLRTPEPRPASSGRFSERWARDRNISRGRRSGMRSDAGSPPTGYANWSSSALSTSATPPAPELIEQVGNGIGVHITLIHSGADAGRTATTTLSAFLDRPRYTAPQAPALAAWPQVPRVHPLRFRVRRDPRTRPRGLPGGRTAPRRGIPHAPGWLASQPSRNVRATGAGHRGRRSRNGPRTGLHSQNRRSARADHRPAHGTNLACTARRPNGLDAARLATIHEYTSPSVAGYILAARVTGLADDLVELIGGDQISNDHILGTPVPALARPVLRALRPCYDPILIPPRHAPPAARETIATHPPDPDSEFHAKLEWLLRSHQNALRADAIAEDLRARFEQLRSQRLLEFYDDAYRANPIALYGTFESSATTDRRLLTSMRDDPLTSRRESRLTNTRDSTPGTSRPDPTAQTPSVDISPIIEHSSNVRTSADRLDRRR